MSCAPRASSTILPHAATEAEWAQASRGLPSPAADATRRPEQHVEDLTLSPRGRSGHDHPDVRSVVLKVGTTTATESRGLALVKSSTAPADQEMTLDMARTTARYGDRVGSGRGRAGIALVEALQARHTDQTSTAPAEAANNSTSAPIRLTAPAETGATCADARSSTPSRSRRTSGPTVDAGAAGAADRPGSTRRRTSAATRSRGASHTAVVVVTWLHRRCPPSPFWIIAVFWWSSQACRGWWPRDC